MYDMYVNAKIIPVEIVPGVVGEGVDGVNSSMIYLIHCKNLCKCYNVSLPSTAIKKKYKKQSTREDSHGRNKA
jgi:hypothetical protein